MPKKKKKKKAAKGDGDPVEGKMHEKAQVNCCYFCCCVYRFAYSLRCASITGTLVRNESFLYERPTAKIVCAHA